MTYNVFSGTLNPTHSRCSYMYNGWVMQRRRKSRICIEFQVLHDCK